MDLRRLTPLMATYSTGALSLRFGRMVFRTPIGLVALVCFGILAISAVGLGMSPSELLEMAIGLIIIVALIYGIGLWANGHVLIGAAIILALLASTQFGGTPPDQPQLTVTQMRQQYDSYPMAERGKHFREFSRLRDAEDAEDAKAFHKEERAQQAPQHAVKPAVPASSTHWFLWVVGAIVVAVGGVMGHSMWWHCRSMRHLEAERLAGRQLPAPWIEYL